MKIRLPCLSVSRLFLAVGLLAVLCVLGLEARSAQTQGLAQADAGCDTKDTVALNAINQAVVAEVNRLRPADDTHTWWVRSVCRQGTWAYAYVKSYSSKTGAPLPSPSDVALVQQTEAGWEASLPEETGAYNQKLAAIPATLIPESMKAMLKQPVAAQGAMRALGYALPYPAGTSAIALKHWYPAIDFSLGVRDLNHTTIRSAKGGTAVFVKDSSTRLCGDPPPDFTCWQWANTIVIQSGANEYTWYMHFVPNSIPDWIREGVYVPAQTDLGLEGSTGWASGPHLHFMVAGSYSCCEGEGDSRIPSWPLTSMYAVDFMEYSWDQLPWVAYSQNGAPVVSPTPAPNPTPETPTVVNEPAPAPVTYASPCANPYIVQPGDWLYRVVEVCNVTYTALVGANPGINPNLIYPGQQLKIPGGSSTVAQSPPIVSTTSTAAASGGTCSGSHVVQPNENLFRLAYNCGYTTQQLAAFNGIRYPYVIYPGQTLRYP